MRGFQFGKEILIKRDSSEFLAKLKQGMLVKLDHKKQRKLFLVKQRKSFLKLTF